MNLPIFFTENITAVNDTLVLAEESSRHIVQVLRMAKGEQILLTNGKGYLLLATIVDDHKKKDFCTGQQKRLHSQTGAGHSNWYFPFKE